MDNTVLITIISTVGVVVAAGIGAGSKLMELWYKGRKEKKKHDTKLPLVDVAKYSMEIDKLLYEIMEKTGATRLMVARFHNGGQFINNIPMDKFSVTNEISKCEHEHSISMRMQNMLLSQYSTVMYDLLFNDKYFKPDIKECDQDFKRIMEISRVKSIYLFLIKNVDGSPIGFIWMSFHAQKKELAQEEISFVWSKHNPILNLMNYRSGATQNKTA